jgi:hypothetical protein
MGYKYVTVCNRLIKGKPSLMQYPSQSRGTVLSISRASHVAHFLQSRFAHRFMRTSSFRYRGYRGGGEKNIEDRRQFIILHQSPNI